MDGRLDGTETYYRDWQRPEGHMAAFSRYAVSR